MVDISEENNGIPLPEFMQLLLNIFTLYDDMAKEDTTDCSIIDKPYLLIVEGKDDRAFFYALCRYLSINNVNFWSVKGKDKMRGVIKLIKNTRGYDDLVSLGIVRDADTSVEDTFKSICDVLNAAGFPIPTKPMEISENRPRIGIMILPDGRSEGRLETLFIKALENEPAMKCTERYFECLNSQGVTYSSKDSEISKSKIQVYLASKQRALKLSEAIEAEYIKCDLPGFEDVRKFLSELFRRSS